MKVEKVSYEVNWKGFKRGTSFFIPCLNTKLAKKEIRLTTDRIRVKVLMKLSIEDGIKGLRVWKV